MSGTARTTSYLLNTSFPSNGPPGNITPTHFQDLVVSGPQFDLTQRSALLNTPYIVRGTVSTYELIQSGEIVIGAGQTTPIRQANQLALQNIINSAASSGKHLEIHPGTYEKLTTAGTPLTVPADGGGAHISIRGSMSDTILVEMYNGTIGVPVLTVGDTTGASSTTLAQIDGLTLYHGTSQTGLTASCYISLGYMQSCVVSNIFGPGAITGGSAFIPEDGIQIISGNSGNFSNIYNNIALYGWQRHGINFTATATGSTGNSWDNIYLNVTGSVGHTSISGNYICVQAAVQDQHFKRLNCEWGACNTVIGTVNVAMNNWEFTTLHTEGIKMTGFNPSFFNILGSTIKIDGMQITSPQILAAGFTGTASVITDYAAQASTVKIDVLTFLQNIATQQDSALQLFLPGSGPLNDDVAVMIFDGGFVNDGTGSSSNNQFTGHLAFDQHLAVTAGVTMGKWSRYTYGPGGSKILNAVIYATATYTHYGQFEDATIIIPNSITSFTITLSPLMGATGTALPRLGNTIHFRRQVGVISGTVTITNGGGAGGALTGSINTAGGGQDVWVQFTNGGTGSNNWAAFTPVS